MQTPTPNADVLLSEPGYDYTTTVDVPLEWTCVCQVCGSRVLTIVQYWAEPNENSLRDIETDPPFCVASTATGFNGARLEPCGHYVRQYMVSTGKPDDDPAPALPQAEHAWRCSCGHLNEGKFGRSGCNDGDYYSICDGCGYECIERRGQVTGRYLLIPISEPWKAPFDVA
jgi:hypothetical protein